MYSVNMNGTRLACLVTKGNLNCLANSYPNPLPPRVGMDNAPQATTKDMHEIID